MPNKLKTPDDVNRAIERFAHQDDTYTIHDILDGLDRLKKSERRVVIAGLLGGDRSIMKTHFSEKFFENWKKEHPVESR